MGGLALAAATRGQVADALPESPARFRNTVAMTSYGDPSREGTRTL